MHQSAWVISVYFIGSRCDIPEAFLSDTTYEVLPIVIYTRGKGT